jgi:ATP-dependent Lon protease
LRGEVTAIGGLKEKLLAALRGGIKTVLIPEENAKDLQEIPENVKNGSGDRAGQMDRQGAGGGAGAPCHALPDEEPVAAASAASGAPRRMPVKH